MKPRCLDTKMYYMRIFVLLALQQAIVQCFNWDIVVTAGNRLEFYTNDGYKKSTAQLYSRNLTAITYDEVHNMLLYVDKQNNNDAICAYNITSSMEYKCYIEKSGRNIQGLAFDPITEALFFTDAKERSINWFSLKPGYKNNVNGKLLIKIDDGIPTDIAVDSCRGYIYWINLNRTYLERARLNGLERNEVTNALSTWNFHSLTIDHQAHKLYFKVYNPSTTLYIYSYDLDSENRNPDFTLTKPHGEIAIVQPNSLIVSKQIFLSVCTFCSERKISRLSKPLKNIETYIFKVNTTSFVGIATNDKIKDQFKGISKCSQVLHDYETTFCVHGLKWTLNGQSLCKCTPGYTGERCEVSVCESTNCFQGNCSITEEGRPICRCNAGYSGDRCEVNVCHGYCRQGNCSFNEEGLPECRCNAGYSGERCEVSVCHGYCSNNGSCSLNEKSEPICQCIRDFLGPRCEVSDCLNYCMQGNCSFNEEGLPECRCNAGYSGERCEVSVCHGYCSNNGFCSLNEKSEPICQCKGDFVGPKCEVSYCLNYCMQGNCSFNEGGLPECRCNTGYSGERCEINVCHQYCLNKGICSLNEEDEPVCECTAEYDGERCDNPLSLNNDVGPPNVTVEPACQCDTNRESSRLKADTKNTISSDSNYYEAGGNLTLADLLANWRKPVATINVYVEVKPNQ